MGISPSQLRHPVLQNCGESPVNVAQIKLHQHGNDEELAAFHVQISLKIGHTPFLSDHFYREDYV